MKTRLKGAQKGHGLLKKKADALMFRFRQILQKIIQVRYIVAYSDLANSIPPHITIFRVLNPPFYFF